MAQALANARLHGKPWYMHFYSGMYWVERDHPVPGPIAGYTGSDHTVVFPCGIAMTYDPVKGPPSEPVNKTTNPGGDETRSYSH